MIPWFPLSIQFFGLQSGGNVWDNWAALSIAAIMVAIIFNTVLLMIGRAFSVKELQAYAESEILQAAATFFMAVFLVVMVGSALEVINDYYLHGTVQCGNQTIPIETYSASNPNWDPGQAMSGAYQDINCNLETQAMEIAAIQDYIFSDASTADEFNALNTQYSFFGITVYRGDWNTALYQTTEDKRITNNLATVLIIALDAQSAVATYLQATMLTIFLPFGILLRSFQLTRGVGALMIALGIGFYFIFPVFFVLLDPGFTPTPVPAPTPAQPQVYCYATMSSTASMIQSVGVGSTSDLVTELSGDDLSQSYVALLVHPLVALFLTLVFVRYIMIILGGEPYELMKMVGKLV
jgi:hypothetical protein